MESFFDLSKQHKDMDGKIVAALERLSHVFRTLLWKQATKHQLTPIQIQLLVYILHHSEELCRVSRLAKEFGLTQPTVSDAVKSLLEKRLIIRKPWEQDRRVSILHLTEQGKRLAVTLSRWANLVKKQVEKLPDDDKETVMHFLMNLLAALQRANLISFTRMCMTCRYFERDAHPGTQAPHHCHLMDRPLHTKDLRMDCPDHHPKDE